jgi:tetratricopeptide (TPR) repeat protein
MPSLYQAARTRILAQTDQKEAVALLDTYISLADETSQPSIAAAWWRKGVAYEQLGDVEEAIDCHRTCLELDRGFEDAAEALQRLQGEG